MPNYNIFSFCKNIMNKISCEIIGHRKLYLTDILKIKIFKSIIYLINNEKVNVFLFGSNSEFTDYCYEVITKLKETYTNIQRVYVRAEYPYVNESYIKHLENFYENSYYFDKNLRSFKSVYVKRNQVMIDNSEYCLFYYNENLYKNKSSGTKLAYNYAISKNKTIINVLNN